MRAAILALLALPACALFSAPLPDPKVVRTLAQAQATCELKGQVILATVDTCNEGQLKLDNLVKTDPDCLQYFGDAGAPTIVCK